jgi:hypothetical protein
MKLIATFFVTALLSAQALASAQGIHCKGGLLNASLATTVEIETGTGYASEIGDIIQIESMGKRLPAETIKQFWDTDGLIGFVLEFFDNPDNPSKDTVVVIRTKYHEPSGEYRGKIYVNEYTYKDDGQVSESKKVGRAMCKYTKY